MEKLIRDNVPTIIRQEGGEPEVRVASQNEYWMLLLAKLKEEVHEFLEEPHESNLADIMEVIDAIKEVMDPERVQQMRDEKARRNGKFSRRFVLNEPDDVQ